MGISAWFESWDSLLKITISAIIGYILLILYVRIVGKRSTSKMNNFDWIVTVAVGSVYASMAVIKDVTVADGALAMGLLLGFQFLLTTATARWEWAKKLFLAHPSVLFVEGQFCETEMKEQRVSKDEILAAVREKGIGSMEVVHVVTLEPDARLSVVEKNHTGSRDTVESVPGYQRLVENSCD